MLWCPLRDENGWMLSMSIPSASQRRFSTARQSAILGTKLLPCVSISFPKIVDAHKPCNALVLCRKQMKELSNWHGRLQFVSTKFRTLSQIAWVRVLFWPGHWIANRIYAMPNIDFRMPWNIAALVRERQLRIVGDRHTKFGWNRKETTATAIVWSISMHSNCKQFESNYLINLNDSEFSECK